MTPLSTLLSWVNEDLPSVPRLVALRALNWAARDFCSFTAVWRAPLDAIPVAANAAQIALPTPAGTEVVRVHAMSFNKRRVFLSDMTVLQQAKEATGTAREPLLFSLATPTDVAFAPVPDTAGVLSAVVSLTPEREAPDGGELPDHLVRRYGEAIADGAKMRLCGQLGRAWTNPAAAAGFRTAYERISSTAKRDAESTYGSAEVQVRLRNWV